MNAWNVHDMIAFVECARLFGMDARIPSEIETEVSVTRRSATGAPLAVIVFNRANGTVAQIAPDAERGSVRTPLNPRQPQTWYSALDISCNIER